MSDQTTTNRFFAIDWSQYSGAGYRHELRDTFQEALSDCNHTVESSAEVQSWKEYSEVVEINPAGDVINSTYFVTL
jgi:hypothetical protein